MKFFLALWRSIPVFQKNVPVTVSREFARNAIGILVSCLGLSVAKGKNDKFPVKFPVCRENSPETVRSALRRQPGRPATDLNLQPAPHRSRKSRPRPRIFPFCGDYRRRLVRSPLSPDNVVCFGLISFLTSARRLCRADAGERRELGHGDEKLSSRPSRFALARSDRGAERLHSLRIYCPSVTSPRRGHSAPIGSNRQATGDPAMASDLFNTFALSPLI